MGPAVIGSVRGARAAFEALVRSARGARCGPGALGPPIVGAAFRDAWMEGLAEAFAETPVLVFVVTASAILLGDSTVVEGADRRFAENLHAAGLRGLTLFSGADDDELGRLAGLLAADLAPGGTALAEAAWEAELVHAHLEIASAPSTEAAAPPPLPPVALPRPSALSPALVQELRQLSDLLPPEPAFLVDAPSGGGAISAELLAEAALVRSGADVAPEALGAALLGALSDRAVGPLAATALVWAGVDLLAGPQEISPLLHRALEGLDPDTTPSDAARTALAQAAASLAVDPMRATLAGRLPGPESAALRGPLFSLLSLVQNDDARVALADALPFWAVRVLADTALLGPGDDAKPRPDQVRARLLRPERGAILLGLAMATRLDDPRLTDAVVTLADHALADVREAVLVALRQQGGPRVHELVARRLADPEAAVRVEALRYAVAHRLTDLAGRIEAALQAPEIERAGEPEQRALCVAYGRLARDRAQPLLLEIALGRARVAPPGLPRLALHGLRAIGTSSAQAALQHVAREVPRLRPDAEAALAGEAR